MLIKIWFNWIKQLAQGKSGVEQGRMTLTAANGAVLI